MVAGFFSIKRMVLGLWKWPKNGLYCLIGLGVIGTIGRYYTTIVYELSNYVYFGTTLVHNLQKTKSIN